MEKRGEVLGGKKSSQKALGQSKADSGGQESETKIVGSDSSEEAGTNAPDTQEKEETSAPDTPEGEEINASDSETPEPETDPAQDASDLPDESGEQNAEWAISELADKIQAMSDELKQCTDAQRDLEKKTIQTLRENATFQIQVRQNMQKELEEAKKKLSGHIFIPLLKEIAELYVEYRDVLGDMEEGIAKDKVYDIFERLKDILEENGCEFGTSEIGTKWRTRYSKLKGKVYVGEKERHETVAKSYNPWIVMEPFVLYPEKVDVYVFDPAQASKEPEDDLNVGSKEETE